MPTYVEILTQNEPLQKQAQGRQQLEVTGVINETRQKIQDYDLTAAELDFFAAAPGVSERASRAGYREAVGQKYQDPASGMTWGAGGVTPKSEEDGGGGRFRV